MTTTRTYLLINYPKFPASLKQALAERGLVLVESDSQPTADLLRRTLACVTEFGVRNIKHPLRARLWRQRLARHGVPIIAWNRDAPYHNNQRAWRLWLFDKLRPLDIYATHSLVDDRWCFADTVLYLPNAADTAAYNLRGDPETTLARLRNPKQYHWDVSFFGILNGNRFKEAMPRQRFFDALANRLDTLKIRHRFVDTVVTPTSMSLEEQVALIQSSRINLNFGAYCDYCDDRTFPPAGLPERYFGIPACGGFLLADRRIHTSDCFEIGRHMDDFSNIDECVMKIRHYLENFNHCRDIAEAGWRHVMCSHTYTNRAEMLHKALLDWHEKRP